MPLASVVLSQVFRHLRHLRQEHPTVAFECAPAQPVPDRPVHVRARRQALQVLLWQGLHRPAHRSGQIIL